MPLTSRLDPEQAHQLAIFTMRHRLIRKQLQADPESLVILFPHDHHRFVIIIICYCVVSSQGIKSVGYYISEPNWNCCRL
jgi:hypothetical protein